MTLGIASGSERDTLRVQRTRRAKIQAGLVMAGLAGFSFDRAYEVVDDVLEDKEALLEFDVPVAAEWFAICGQQIRQEAEDSEKRDALKDEAMSLDQWSLWKTRLQELQAQSSIVQCVATEVLDAMHRVDKTNRSKSCETVNSDPHGR
ncbi:hypothetical protein T440DRAFT_530820 [Plenodomus tracheiphilus IPT5]|uniref:Uncharacterized protein n=1 Tax=Plenodomus tracheiphilus IPT5 TaxID=1408161 RepID=A0A6A7B5S4_9PLEO|nr:hypothetical protein T440DRAFT_530820 [Plenodomus tracheiphilus IPT5]